MNHAPASSLSTDNATRRERVQRNKATFNKKRDAFLQDLVRNLDLLIYAQLSTVYYMDCSFTRFLVRAVIQFMFLTPKPAFLPEPPHPRPYLGAIVGSNFLIILLHVLLDHPEAGEATRGYLHGGLAMDFIGQKGPTSKFHLVLLDILILLMQLIHLAATVTRQRVKQQTSTTTTPPTALQNHDFEERGQHRSDHQPVDQELHSLNPNNDQPEEAESNTQPDEEADERQALLASTAPRTDSYIFDAFNSGEIMIADLNLFDVIKTQLKEMRDPVQTTGTAPSTAGGLRARLADRSAFFRMRVGDRIFNV
ncbi:DUF1746-domain-containing protein [Aureobasidium pullulans]|uniref:DUF1746-domain-containing protein n=1 Tax=Aureobasidium pullulans TaxID=5580 RepID=A0A4S9F9N2_AURPU|nr:DUF1746-domain-containing protein [Aureobasidium pullulans]